jgi:poly(A) polymerase
VVEPVDELRRCPLPFSARLLDRRAVRIVLELQRKGHDAYLVGGCVRDLVAGVRPKDFDIATSARPEQVRRIFRRSRIIGRRFRLAHVMEGPNVYEVATFRRAPGEADDPEEPSIILDDNVYGTAREDALRRDFTVNGLFLDPAGEGEILDWTGGMEDLRRRRLLSIGDPALRFREDPVRILRLIRFFRRLGLEPGEEEVAAAREAAPDMEHAAQPRVVEEVFRLALSGDMEGCFADLIGLGLLPVLLPDIAAWAEGGPERLDRLYERLARLDEWVKEEAEPCYSVRLAFLYGPLVEQEFDPRTRTLPVKEVSQVTSRVLARLQERARLPRQALNRAAAILKMQLRLDPPPWFKQRRRKRSDEEKLVAAEHFEDALEYLRHRLVADGRDLAPFDEWKERALSLGSERR